MFEVVKHLAIANIPDLGSIVSRTRNQMLGIIYKRQRREKRSDLVNRQLLEHVKRSANTSGVKYDTEDQILTYKSHHSSTRYHCDR